MNVIYRTTNEYYNLNNHRKGLVTLLLLYNMREEV
jgi:hypothetical protein